VFFVLVVVVVHIHFNITIASKDLSDNFVFVGFVELILLDLLHSYLRKLKNMSFLSISH
jgi:hypothetical protein